MDNGGVRPYSTDSDYNKGLNLADATFNGVALGGDAADGVAFFAAGYNNGGAYGYAGILSGTNLGAPLTDTQGTAKWIGSFREEGRDAVDFVLNISFGTGDGAGEIEALVRKNYARDYYIVGEFDDSGVITGTAWRGYSRSGKLTGLIGEEGAIGAFVTGDYFGGFVARPSSATELQTLAQTCNDNPFHEHCAIGYESERHAIIQHCITGGNANDESCDSANDWYACIRDPFGSDLRVSFCEDNAGIHPSCPAPEGATPQVTASVWADSFDEPLSHGVTADDTKSQFLIGRETDLDNGGVRPYSTDSDYNKGLNLADATFNGVALGGDAADGVAFFAAGYNNGGAYGYAGILSGTNLGAPLTDTQGTAKWIGSFREEGRDAVDFVLNISFGTGDGAGEIEALVRKNYARDYYIVGEFDDSGVITGTAWRGYSRSGKLTGLIGEEGAIGAFVTGDYFGGFVARPSSATELQTLAQTCNDNPFHEHCAIGYESERHAIIQHCITGGNANDESCDSANDWYACIRDPFGSDLRVSFCEDNAGIHPSCPAPEGATPQVTASVWADSFDEPLSHGVTADDTKSQFLIGRETDLDNGGVRPYSTDSDYNKGLNLADATFNGVALGGDAADGVAFFAAGYNNGGAYGYAGILSGTNLGAPLTDTQGTAKWIGSFREEGRDAVDFVLNISFGTGDGAGEIEALVRKNYARDYYIVGEFDDSGVITGTAWRGYSRSGKLTGLIGEEGAIGAFVTGDYFGGFVARPSSATELQTLAQTCNDNPFHEHCAIGYESERHAIIQHCITGGNANDESCDSANDWYACIRDPFGSDLRVSFCEDNAGIHPSCPAPEGATPQVTASVWADSFDEPLSHGVTADDTKSQFLIGRETDLDNGGVRPYSTDSDYNKGLNLADATFNGVALGGDAADGVAFFAAGYNNGGAYGYAGILSGTNLGAPLTDTQGTAKWIGSFREEGRDAVDFVLNISFGTGDGAGEIEALVRKNYARDYYIVGEFDDSGVITGTAWRGYSRSGKLTGLIGEEGAIGAFVTGDYFGGFVARPSSATELQTLAQTCNDNPFHEHCAIGYESERHAIIQHCITGGNANDESCDSANDWYACIRDPFGSDLRVSFCEDNAGIHPSCPAPEGATPQVTASVWADSFDEPLSHGVTADDTKSQFLIGRETDLDNGGVRPYSTDSDYNKGLNLADATFNRVALGGDAADGVAFFAAGYNNGGAYGYAGILSGTNLGAPLTDTQGTAKWIGSFREEGRDAVDFVLNISFGTGDGAGEIEALVRKNYARDYYIVGEFDDSGVITGTAWRGYSRSGKLTGLIGEEGAIGAFVTGDYFGGFVARPSSATELQTLAQTCNDNPFHEHCAIGYESERHAIIQHCITGGNANDESCDSANDWYACIRDPFGSDLRVSFCEDNVGTHPSCPAPEPTITEPTTPQVTASVWADSF